jgi:hypothetical protein
MPPSEEHREAASPKVDLPLHVGEKERKVMRRILI